MREYLQGGEERPLPEAVERKPRLHWRHQDVGDTRIVGYLQTEWNQSKRSVLKSAELEGKSHLSPSTSGVEGQDLEFTMLGFGLVLVQYFFTMPLFLHFWNGNVYAMSLYVGNTSFSFYFTGVCS